MKVKIIVLMLGVLLFITGCATTNWEPTSRYVAKEPKGRVTATQMYIHPLFMGKSPEYMRMELQNKALEEAHNQYGSDSYLSNIQYYSNLNILGILFYFDMLGFVEDATITADVVTKDQLENLKQLDDDWNNQHPMDHSLSKLYIGMFKSSVLNAWGPPDRTSTTITSNNTTDYWWYDSTTCLIFENNRLSMIDK